MTNNNDTMNLPPGYFLRHPTRSDCHAVAKLIHLHEHEFRGVSEFMDGDVLISWERMGFDLSKDSWIITRDPDHPFQEPIIIGYSYLTFRKKPLTFYTNIIVHPESNRILLINILIDLLHQRADEILIGNRVKSTEMRIWFDKNDLDLRSELQRSGYSKLRSFLIMEISLDRDPPLPEVPDNIIIRKFNPVDDTLALFKSLEEAFQDHWDYPSWNLDQWRKKMFAEDRYDPSLWFLAVEGDQIVGGCICRETLQIGWIRTLAVRKAWRGLGIGKALLNHSFRKLRSLGFSRAGLTVDAENPTGAKQLYESVGMYVSHVNAVYSKQIQLINNSKTISSES